ncbi:MAG: alanine racemase [Erysipelotrichaceae bacterium]|nr:alanine racemase [Erysipelotrichaceae bacterium]
MRTPRIEIDLRKITDNTRKTIELYRTKGIEIAGVLKGVAGDFECAKAMVSGGIIMVCDSNVDHLLKLRQGGIDARLMLIRTPALSEVDRVIEGVDISLNTELAVIKKLSEVAKQKGKPHKILLMVEMGDRREGIDPEDLPGFIERILDLPNIELVGIGANFACMTHLPPDESTMRRFCDLADQIEQRFNLHLTYVSGGNSANYHWFNDTKDVGKINHLRLGESILVGVEAIHKDPIPGLVADAFILVCEIIEKKEKQSTDGKINQAIVNIGYIDTKIEDLDPLRDVEILGSSSNHLVIDLKKENLDVGDEIRFSMRYFAVVGCMTTQAVAKEYIHR